MEELDIPMSLKMNFKCFPGIETLAQGKSINESQILELLEYIDRRYDCADFRMIPIIRTLYAYSSLISKPMLERIETTVLGFKYWMDEPGEDSMCYWSENHQLIFATIEYLAGQYYPDKVFTNNNMSGIGRMTHSKKRLLNWLQHRYQYGFVEWHSNTYYEEDIAPLSLLIDFAEDEEIVSKATMLMDLLLLDLAVNNYHGYFVATSGRCYEEQKQNPNYQDVLDIMKKAFDLGPVKNYDYTRLSAEFILNQKYQVPEVIKLIARSKETFILKESMGLDLHEVREKIDPQNRIETTGLYYWSMEAFTNVESIKLTMEMFKEWNLETNTFLKNLSTVDKWGLRKLNLLPTTVKILNPVTQGIAIQRANTYSYRHRDYFLSTAQIYHPLEFGDQQHINQATLGKDITVFTTHPGRSFFDDNARNFSPSYWVGNGINPYAVQHENTALIYYDLSPKKGYLEKERLMFSHIYFPEGKFDEVVIDEDILIGRSGKSLIGVKALHKIRKANENEWIQDGKKTAWAITLASTDDVSFADFKDKIINSQITLKGKFIAYQLDSQIKIILGKKAKLVVDGVDINTNYLRYELPFINASATTKAYHIQYQNKNLLLNFDEMVRKYD